eukprot:7061074-Prorocentrum_lima.AAC.1
MDAAALCALDIKGFCAAGLRVSGFMGAGLWTRSCTPWTQRVCWFLIHSWTVLLLAAGTLTRK